MHIQFTLHMVVEKIICKGTRQLLLVQVLLVYWSLGAL